ncbi:MAG: hypothetical protein ABIY51_13665 [Ferruginibacter sp.]
MLSPEQNLFIHYWETNRERYNSFASKFLRGLPFAIISFAPILLFVGMVYLFFPDWYGKISNSSPASYFVAVIAVLITILFFAYFRMQFKWEMNEQLYHELLIKQQKENAAN